MMMKPSWSDPEIQPLLPLLYGHFGFQTLYCACELGIFEFLSRNPGSSAAAIAEAVGLEAHPARLLLGACCVTRLLKRTGDGYSNAAIASRLIKDAPGSVLPLVWSGQHLQYEGFHHMLEALKVNSNAGLRAYSDRQETLYECMSVDSAREDRLYDAMACIWEYCQDGLDDVPELFEARNVLDVAGGIGYAAGLLIDRYSHLNVTVFDRRSACVKCAERARRQGREESIHTIAGNVLTDPLPDGFDVVTFLHCLEWLTPQQAVSVLERAHRALPEGGSALCFQFAMDGGETDNYYSSSLSMYFLIIETGAGMAYPSDEIASFFKEAGFRDVRVRPGLPFEHSMVVGTK